MTRILIVDDDEDLQELFTRALERAGIETTTVGNGRAALRALSEAEFDAVVMDIVMPEMDGLELLREIQRRDPKPRTVVVSGSAVSMQSGAYLFAAQEFGADLVLAKPVLPNDLVRQIVSLCSRP